MDRATGAAWNGAPRPHGSGSPAAGRAAYVRHTSRDGALRSDRKLHPYVRVTTDRCRCVGRPCSGELIIGR
ncbi:hypothetical protein I3J09_28700 (plasmid) [Streptomyces clavuligerus]|nr:hypothetical protein D1794_33030 [Streptomyces clavuligerus]MBY6306904.1 hypothetical protein [Streptomyces clavuligerus]QPJ98448.1 hypothetical protein GE265_30730 [Streptomyces clavuligerus]QPL67398.1 hypothetical protein I3J04_28805 [Streptomyces clavuligerus]QPL73428.1 hypothetical protein I3J05_28855 [Streptomyces clavuligerus]